MLAVIQRVRSASVEVEGQLISRIQQGLLVLLGAARDDTDEDAAYLAEKIPMLRIFPDEQGKMNRSLRDIQGQILVVSQFTLLADVYKGRRPGFDRAAPPERARELYQQVIDNLNAQGFSVHTGLFGAKMLVTLQNDGPATFLLDSQQVISRKIGLRG
ncbi:MAG: D-tyrosyl-tRNA(Tyr) deacylase [Nitrospirae bacterium]|nr:MAG: D-tyrosyl-tRNA(Tyr) deacylase [Nitrospirota bacterium]